MRARGQASVEWLALVLLVAVALGVAAAPRCRGCARRLRAVLAHAAALPRRARRSAGGGVRRARRRAGAAPRARRSSTSAACARCRSIRASAARGPARSAPAARRSSRTSCTPARRRTCSTGSTSPTRRGTASPGRHADDWESYQVRVDASGRVRARASAHHGYTGRRIGRDLEPQPGRPVARPGGRARRLDGADRLAADRARQPRGLRGPRPARPARHAGRRGPARADRDRGPACELRGLAAVGQARLRRAGVARHVIAAGRPPRAPRQPGQAHQPPRIGRRQRGPPRLDRRSNISICSRGGNSPSRVSRQPLAGPGACASAACARRRSRPRRARQQCPLGRRLGEPQSRRQRRAARVEPQAGRERVAAVELARPAPAACSPRRPRRAARARRRGRRAAWCRPGRAGPHGGRCASPGLRRRAPAATRVVERKRGAVLPERLPRPRRVGAEARQAPVQLDARRRRAARPVRGARPMRRGWWSGRGGRRTRARPASRPRPSAGPVRRGRRSPDSRAPRRACTASGRWRRP